MQRFLIKLILDNSSRIISSVSKAYKDIIAQSGQKTANTNRGSNTSSKKDPFSNINFSDISGTNTMTKSEALKILNFSEKEKLNARQIIQRYEKYFENNDPNKGGSFYLQNKFYYAKEILIKDFPNEDTKSKFDYKTTDDYNRDDQKI
jgi:hypothetical protein